MCAVTCFVVRVSARKLPADIELWNSSGIFHNKLGGKYHRSHLHYIRNFFGIVNTSKQRIVGSPELNIKREVSEISGSSYRGIIRNVILLVEFLGVFAVDVFKFIGISPGFFPAELWASTVSRLTAGLREAGQK